MKHERLSGATTRHIGKQVDTHLSSRKLLLIALGGAIVAGGCALTSERTGQLQEVSPVGTAPITHVTGLLRYPDGFVAGRILMAAYGPKPPAHCDPVRAVRQIEALFRAIASGDSAIVSRFFPVEQPERFEFYGLPGAGTEHFITSDLSKLREHFRLRYLANESLELRGIQINRWDDNLVHFGPLFVARSANDLPPGVLRIGGKGAIDCKTDKIVVLNLVVDRERLP